MKEQLTKIWGGLKEFWNKQTPKIKKTVLISAGGVLGLAIILVVYLNVQGMQYKTLWPGMTSAETQQVFAQLSTDMPEAQANIDSGGKLKVLSGYYDEAMLRMAQEGFPKTTLTYDNFLNSSFTATEYQQKKALVIDTQKAIASTLMQGYDGVQEAIVLLNLPEESTHVWDQEQQNTGSASVKMVMRNGATLSGLQVTGIKNLVAHAVRDILPENVTVTDSSNIPLNGTEDVSGVMSNEWIKYEQQLAREMETKAQRLLAPVYGDGKVIPVASVTLNFDQMKKENKTLVPKEDGSGYLLADTKDYTLSGTVPAGGLVGEEDNTDVPSYLQGDPNADGGTTDYHSSDTYDYGYELTQTEKAAPYVETSSIAIMIDDTNNTLTQQRILELGAQIAMATGIAADRVSISAMNPMDEDQPVGGDDIEGTKSFFEMIPWYYFAIGGVVILLIVLLILLLGKRKKAKVAAAEQESEELINSLQQEIEDRKRQLTEAAQQDNNPSDGAIMQEVRSFAKENPEITANLIRSWLKEDQ